MPGPPPPRSTAALACLGVLAAAATVGCQTAISFEELAPFGIVGTRSWFTSNYFVDGVQHDSHTFVISSRNNYCDKSKQLRADRADAAAAYWGWVGMNVGWDVARGDAELGDGEVAVLDVASTQAAWCDRAGDYLAAAADLWDAEFGGTENIAWVQFDRGSTYPAADRTEHGSPFRPAFDGEGEISLGVYGVDAEPGDWRFHAAVGTSVGSPYAPAIERLEATGCDAFSGLASIWRPQQSGTWHTASAGTLEMSRFSVHSWDLDLRDGELIDSSGNAAGDFRIWGNYYRCFVDYGELQDGPDPTPPD